MEFQAVEATTKRTDLSGGKIGKVYLTRAAVSMTASTPRQTIHRGLWLTFDGCQVEFDGLVQLAGFVFVVALRFESLCLCSWIFRIGSGAH